MVNCSDMMHGFELGDWRDKVTKWDVWIDAMTLQDEDRASRKDHTQLTLSRAGMCVPIDQNTENGIEDVTIPTVETTSITTTARRNVINHFNQERMFTS